MKSKKLRSKIIVDLGKKFSSLLVIEKCVWLSFVCLERGHTQLGPHNCEPVDIIRKTWEWPSG